MNRKFVRSGTYRFSRLGKGRPKLQKWRRPRGKHNKTRLKRFSYPVQPGIGFGTPRINSGKVQGLIPIVVNNLNELQALNNKNIAIISQKVGARKKIDMIKKASELKIKIANVGGKK